MTTKPHYLVKIWYSEEDDCYVAEVPALRGCMTHGNFVYSCCRDMALEATECWLEDARKQGDPIP